MNNPHTPNFENFDFTQKAFNSNAGFVCIGETRTSTYVVFELERSFSYTKDGKYREKETYPTLFESFQQFQDYWAWEAENTYKELVYELAKEIRSKNCILEEGTSVECFDNYEVWWAVNRDVNGNMVDRSQITNHFTETKESGIKRLLDSGIVRVRK